ncbi:MAG: 1,4-dihydroxy-2-naphthoate polyprenyltransferase [Bacteroidetes bacterium]|nr:1,4-dihydroxy-2-naphthoate polyprenyltransferase [Bacteroidota bacterium]MBS1541530.1 1,4-dihydroxy-2-naphthoate polyprenyltransferase [Bacteroidota bacterium]
MLKPWIEAFRPRTLPLSLSCIGMGAFLAAAQNQFNGTLFFLCCLTTVFLQVLSNLANDYGDTVNGADHAQRKGPLRAVQSGVISEAQMRKAIFIFIILCLASGVALLYLSFGWQVQHLLFFLMLGLLCIVAAIAYTMGKKPYGYSGLGDLSVLIFFGFVGVIGSQYLFTKTFFWIQIFPALSCGFFSMAVLNINNIRDIDSDRSAGKYSIPVRVGKEKAIGYHWFLLSAGLVCAVLFVVLDYQSPQQFLFLLASPLFFLNGMNVATRPSEKLDPMLKQMALATLLFVVLFGVGNLI